MCRPLDETGAGRVYFQFSADRHVRETIWDRSTVQSTRGVRVNGLPLRVGIDFNVSPYSICILQADEKFGPIAHLNNQVLRRFEVLDEISLDDTDTTQASTVLVQRLLSITHGIKADINVSADASGASRSTKGEGGRTDWDILRRELTKC